MPSEPDLLYLSRADVETLALPLVEVIEAVELGLKEKALGRTIMPPKHWLAPDEHRFFSAMTSAVPAVAAAACKWQSGSDRNAARGLPYITGLLLLNELESGLPIAVMDSTWITAQRTAAATAVAARHLARPASRTVAILGCGVQGRTNLEALRLVLPGLDTVRAYDIDPARTEAYGREIEARHPPVRVQPCASAREALRSADIVVSCGPITPTAARAIAPDWLEAGTLGVTLDYDCYWSDAALAAADGLYTDDVEQVRHLKEYGYFRASPPVTAELGAVVAGLAPGRVRPQDVIVTINMGVAVEDVTTAARVYALAVERGRGLRLPL